MALFKFTQDELKESKEFDLLTPGKYTAQICNHEWKATKNGGHYLALTLEVTAPTNAGAKLWDNLNIDNASDEAAKIAMQTMKSVCVACNATDYLDAMFNCDSMEELENLFESLPSELYAKDITITVGVEKGKDQYPDKNKIKGYAAATTAAKPASGKPSWKK